MNITCNTHSTTIELILVGFIAACLFSCSSDVRHDMPEDYQRRAFELIDLGDFDNAKLVLDTIASNTRNVFGDESGEYVIVLGYIVDCLRLGKHYSEAESLAIVIVDLPVNDEIVLAKTRAYVRLSDVYLDMDEPDLAIDCLMRGRVFASESLGPVDTMVSEIVLRMAKVYALTSRPDSAMKLEEQYLAIREYQADHLDSEYLGMLL